MIGHNGAMRSVWSVVLVFVVGLLCGCSQSPYSDGGTRDPNPIRSIVSLSPGTTELVFQLQLGQILQGRTSSCDYPPGVEKVRIVVSGTKPDFEKIISIHPQLVVYDAKLYANTDMSKLKSIPGIEVMPMDVDTVQQYMDFVLTFGARCGAPTFASEHADQIYSMVENAKAGAQGEAPRVAVLTGSGGAYYAAGKDSFLADVVKVSGGQPIGPEGKIFTPMAMEALVQADPEIILTSESGAALLKDPRLASVSAVKSKRVFEVEASVLLRTSPRVKTLIENLSNTIQLTKKAKAN